MLATRKLCQGFAEMLLAAIVAVAGALAAYVAVVCIRVTLTWQMLAKLPHPASSSTLAGSLELVEDLDHVLHNLLAAGERLGTGIFSMRVAHIASVVITDPALVAQVLSLPKARPNSHAARCLRACLTAS